MEYGFIIGDVFSTNLIIIIDQVEKNWVLFNKFLTQKPSGFMEGYETR